MPRPAVVLLWLLLLPSGLARADEKKIYGQLELRLPPGFQAKEEKNQLAVTDATGRTQLAIYVVGEQPAKADTATFCGGAWKAVGGDATRTPGKLDAPQGWQAFGVTGALGANQAFLACYRIGDRLHAFIFGAPSDKALKASEPMIRAFLGSVSVVGAAGGGGGGAPPELYVGVRAGAALAVGTDVLALFPDGSAVARLPPEGFDGWDVAAEKRSGREVARWEKRGTKLAWRESGGNEWIYDWKDGGWQGTSRVAGSDYVKVEPVAGLRLRGVYARADYKPADFASSPTGMWTLEFRDDGTFVDNHQVKTVFASPSQRPFVGDAFIARLAARAGGTYAIRNHTLTLRYEDGRVVPLAFYIHPRVGVSPSPKVIHVGSHDLTLR